MRSKLLLILGFVVGLSAPSYGAIFPSGPTLTVGGRNFTDLANLIVLEAYTATANHYSSLVKLSGASVVTTAYQVTSGKTFSVCGVRVIAASSSAATCQMQMLYGTGFVLSVDQASAPTGAVFPMGLSASGGFQFMSTAPATTPTGYDTNWTIPASDYPAIQTLSTTGCVIYVYGYEAHDCTQ